MSDSVDVLALFRASGTHLDIFIKRSGRVSELVAERTTRCDDDTRHFARSLTESGGERPAHIAIGVQRFGPTGIGTSVEDSGREGAQDRDHRRWLAIAVTTVTIALAVGILLDAPATGRCFD